MKDHISGAESQLQSLESSSRERNNLSLKSWRKPLSLSRQYWAIRQGSILSVWMTTFDFNTSPSIKLCYRILQVYAPCQMLLYYNSHLSQQTLSVIRGVGNCSSLTSGGQNVPHTWNIGYFVLADWGYLASEAKYSSKNSIFIITWGFWSVLVQINPCIHFRYYLHGPLHYIDKESSLPSPPPFSSYSGWNENIFPLPVVKFFFLQLEDGICSGG